MDYNFESSLSSVIKNLKMPNYTLPQYDEGESPYELLQKNAHNSEQQRRLLENQIEPLKEIANAAKRQADSAEEQASSANEIAEAARIQACLAIDQSEKADKTARAAKVRSIISIILAALSLIVSLLANADKIVHNAKTILSCLGMQ